MRTLGLPFIKEKEKRKKQNEKEKPQYSLSFLGFTVNLKNPSAQILPLPLSLSFWPNLQSPDQPCSEKAEAAMAGNMKVTLSYPSGSRPWQGLR